MQKNRFDAQLHLLRSAARAIEDEKLRSDAEQARFNLFTELQNGNQLPARDWLDALNLALRTGGLDHVTQSMADRAIQTICRGLQADASSTAKRGIR